MNDFYKQPRWLQWFVAIVLLIIGFYPVLVLFDMVSVQPVYGLLFLLYIPVIQFTFTPMFTLTGLYKYYSPMLLGYIANDIQIDLHNGSSFDYWWVMRKYKTGTGFRNRILMYHLEGMLNIITQIENNAIPKTVNIIGTSYFFNNRTLQKLGFEMENPSLFYRINLLINFVDLTWMYSLAHGRLSIPNLIGARKLSITGSRLMQSRYLIEGLYNKMTEKLNKNT